MTNARTNPETAIAIVGLACRFPGAPNERAFLETLFSGREAITRFSREELRVAGLPQQLIDHPDYVPAAGILDRFDRFDSEFFGYSPRDAELLDPQQRHFLECAWLALEDAGLAGRIRETSIGVFAGADTNTYLLNNIMGRPDVRAQVGDFAVIMANEKDFLATRVAYKLGLRGPAISMQTACSTSLVAVATACQALLDFQCDVVLAGGVSLRAPHLAGYVFEPGGIHSPDGRCRPFDVAASGTVTSSGVGVVCLQRAEAARGSKRRTRALITGWAINNDGSDKIGFSAPSASGQAECIQVAQSFAGIGPADVHYVETHGTGTPLGDAIEIKALAHAFGSTKRPSPLRLGAVKAVIGHCGAAAGIAGLIKAVLCLENERLAPQPAFTAPNPNLSMDPQLFRVVDQVEQWPRGNATRRAGVSSFGIGGTNAHIVLEEGELIPAEVHPPRRSRPVICMTSAKTRSACEANARAIADHLNSTVAVCNEAVEAELAFKRAAFGFRAAGVGASALEAAISLQDAPCVQAGKPALLFLFPGQASQRRGMFRDLDKTWPSFARYLAVVAGLVRSAAGWDIREVIEAPDSDPRLQQTRFSQPCVFAVEYALAMAFVEICGPPTAMLGHSLGEIVAATLAGVFDVETAVRFVVARGELMQRCAGGRMISVAANSDAVARHIGPASIAGFNGPHQTVIGGSADDIELAVKQLEAAGFDCTGLFTSHAFHTASMEPAVCDLRAGLAEASLNAPRIRFGSSASGGWIEDSEAVSAQYWAEHIRHPVRFAEMASRCAELGSLITIELGAGAALTGLLADVLSDGRTAVRSLAPAKGSANPSLLNIAEGVASLWCHGIDIDWGRWGVTEDATTPLPGYSFDAERYWVDPPGVPQPLLGPVCRDHGSGNASQSARRPELHPRPRLATPYVSPTREEERIVAGFLEDILGLARVGIDDPFDEIGGHSLAAVRLVGRVRDEFNVTLPVRAIFENRTARLLCEEIDRATLESATEQELANLSDIPSPRLESLSEADVSIAPAKLQQVIVSARRFQRPTALRLSVFFFAGTQDVTGPAVYETLMKTAELADSMGLEAVWVPDRHFHEFGAPYASPSVLAAALAIHTKRIGLRAGSVVLPARHPIRVAEEWAMVDNLSAGRVGVAFASGFHPLDFVYRPENFTDRTDKVLSGLAAVRTLWSGKTLPVTDGAGNSGEIRLFPRPVQHELPVWLTSAGRSSTFANAARVRAKVLTAPLELNIDQLVERTDLYYDEYKRHHASLDGAGVSVMLHAFLGESTAQAKSIARGPFQKFLRSHAELSKSLLKASGMGDALSSLSEDDTQAILDHAFERFVDGPSLIGDRDKCAGLLTRLSALGITEIACLVDFGLDFDQIEASLTGLAELI